MGANARPVNRRPAHNRRLAKARMVRNTMENSRTEGTRPHLGGDADDAVLISGTELQHRIHAFARRGH